MALQVDIDPRPGEELKQERARALADLRPFNPPPSFIIDSGGGFQGFWLLDEDRPNVDEDSAAQLERYNRQVALQLGGDLCCYEIDSLMRLPGAINVPQGKKIDQGRVPALARLVEFHDGRRYPLRAFTAARKVKRRWTWDPELRDAAQTEQPETDEGCEFKIPF